MKRLDLHTPDAQLIQHCAQLAGADMARQQLVLTLLAGAGRWPAVLAYLQVVDEQLGRDAVRCLALQTGDDALLYVASEDATATTDTLASLKAWAWVNSDADASALARAPQPDDGYTDTTPPPNRQQWLSGGLCKAVAGGDVARAHWWLAQGADPAGSTVHGRRAADWVDTVPMLDWLLAQGVALRVSEVDHLARYGRADLLQRLAQRGHDFGAQPWCALLRLVLLGSAHDLEQALAGPQAHELRAQVEVTEGWGRTPMSFAAQLGDVRKLWALQQAGANVQVMWLEYPLGWWVLDSGSTDAMRWWLAQAGAQVDAPFGGPQDTLLLGAIERDDLPMAELLLNAGADVHLPDGQELYPVGAATSQAMQALLLAHGAREDETGRASAQLALNLPHGDPFDTERNPEWLLGCTPVEFAAAHAPRWGTENGEDITTAFHVAMIESNESAHGAARAFGLQRSFADPSWQHVWNADRYGQSLTVLPDGRCIQIGGEHEDGYDPDFFIYNDVIVHTPPAPGSADSRWDRRVLAYPEAVFAPTDFHSATLVGDEIVVIGCLGYPAQRLAKHTPVYALHIHSLQMRELKCTGDMPGWIHDHRAERCGTHGARWQAGHRRPLASPGRKLAAGPAELPLAAPVIASRFSVLAICRIVFLMIWRILPNKTSRLPQPSVMAASPNRRPTVISASNSAHTMAPVHSGERCLCRDSFLRPRRPDCAHLACAPWR